MAFRFQKANCVVVGTFNMYILRPDWLVKRQIIETGTEVAIESNLARPGFRYHLPKYQVIWAVAPDRLVIESDKPQADCGELIAKVLTALPETPLFAIGNNATYWAEPAEAATLSTAIRDFPQTPCPDPGETIAQRTFHVAVRRNEHDVVNLQLSLKDDRIELSCNAHVELPDPQNANATAVAAAARFIADRDYSKKLAQHFFGSSIENDLNNN